MIITLFAKTCHKDLRTFPANLSLVKKQKLETYLLFYVFFSSNGQRLNFFFLLFGCMSFDALHLNLVFVS